MNEAEQILEAGCEKCSKTSTRCSSCWEKFWLKTIDKDQILKYAKEKPPNWMKYPEPTITKIESLDEH